MYVFQYEQGLANCRTISSDTERSRDQTVFWHGQLVLYSLEYCLIVIVTKLDWALATGVISYHPVHEGFTRIQARESNLFITLYSNMIRENSFKCMYDTWNSDILENHCTMNFLSGFSYVWIFASFILYISDFDDHFQYSYLWNSS